MKTFFSDIRGIFGKEKSYIFLLILIVFFYGMVIGINTSMKDNTLLKREFSQGEQAEKRQAKDEMKTGFQEVSKNPQVIKEKIKQEPQASLAVEIFGALFVIFLSLGIFFGARDLVHFYKHGSFLTASHRILNVTWNAADVIKMIIVFMGISIIVNLGLAFLKLLMPDAVDNSFLMITHTFIMDLIAVFIILSLIKKKGSAPHDLGIPQAKDFKSNLNELWIGIRVYFVIFPILIAILLILMVIANLFSFEPEPHPLAEVLMQEHLSPWTVVISLAVACVVGPAIEELFFRGFLYSSLKKYWGIVPTTLVTTTFFALVHENAFAFLPIFFLGVVLCYVYEKRKSLVPCVTLHIFHNTAFMIYFFLTKIILTNGVG